MGAPAHVPARKFTPEFKTRICIDWRTGEYTKADLAKKYGVSFTFIGNLVDSIEKDLSGVVSDGISYFRTLAGLDETTGQSVQDLVKLRCAQIGFISDVTMKNVAYVGSKIHEKTKLSDHFLIQDTLYKARQTVDPVAKSAGVQINQNLGGGKSLRDMSDEELIEESKRIEERMRVVGNGK